VTYKERENAIKLDLLESVAISQRALSRMLDGVADASDSSAAIRQHLRANIIAISRCQRIIVEHITSTRIAKLRNGKPGKLWINTAIGGICRK
jgi:hypothetical protein